MMNEDENSVPGAAATTATSSWPDVSPPNEEFDPVDPVLRAQINALDEKVRAEIVFGTLVVQPSPAVFHQNVVGGLIVETDGPFRRGRGGPGGWLFLADQQIRLGTHVVRPDIAGWRRERMPTLPKVAEVSLAPDWICEVHSPSNRGYDRVKKALLYREQKIPYLWFVEPDDQTLEVFKLNSDGLYVLLATHTGDEKIRAEPFDAVEINLGTLWEL